MEGGRGIGRYIEILYICSHILSGLKIRTTHKNSLCTFHNKQHTKSVYKCQKPMYNWGMRKYQKKNIAFVASLLQKPIWYNQAITHRSWVAIKRAIRKQEPISMIDIPPTLDLDKLQELRNWQRATEIYAIKPPVTVRGATV